MQKNQVNPINGSQDIFTRMSENPIFSKRALKDTYREIYRTFQSIVVNNNTLVFKKHQGHIQLLPLMHAYPVCVLTVLLSPFSSFGQLLFPICSICPISCCPTTVLLSRSEDVVDYLDGFPQKPLRFLGLLVICFILSDIFNLSKFTEMHALKPRT